MNPMMAAIKKRKGYGSEPGDHSAGHTPQHTDVGAPSDQPQDGAGKLQAIVESLKPHEHEQLKSLLDQAKPDRSQQIAKGAPSTKEQGKIAEAASQENAQNAMEEHEDDGGSGVPEHVHDEIGMSMLDSRHKNGMATEKPRNLGDRVKQGIASKLKAKGKI